jgi:gamma-glutamylcyclotransferase (GGCT)/AIG2-like uncharacterized protein YtfP
VFVYGSLRRGQYNHSVLAGASFVGRGVLPGATMLDLGSFPAVVLGGPEPGPVVGEVYDAPPDVLARLDRLEGHPTFYRRTPTLLQDGSTVDTYLYQAGTHEAYPIVHGGDWTALRR